MKGMTEAAYKAHQQRIHKPRERRELMERLNSALWVRPKIELGPKSRSKHGNIKVVAGGIKFDSKHEARCWADLKLREKAGEIRNLQRQVSFPIQVNGQPVHRVVLDFWYFEKISGSFDRWSLVVADAKSVHTRNLNAWRRAKALFEAAYGIEIRET